MSFKAVNWTPSEQIGGRKTNQMSNNTDWLYNNTPRAIYSLPDGLRRAEGIKIASGRVIITKRNDDSAKVEVRLGNYFSTRCEPNITTGVVSAHQPRIHCVVSGIGRLLPDHRGFQVETNIAAAKEKNDKIVNSFYVAWNAMGY